jgi:hypothetical protein
MARKHMRDSAVYALGYTVVALATACMVLFVMVTA